MRASEATYLKTWRLRKALTSTRKALSYCREQLAKKPDRPGLNRMMIEPLETDIMVIEGELKRRRALSDSEK